MEFHHSFRFPDQSPRSLKYDIISIFQNQFPIFLFTVSITISINFPEFKIKIHPMNMNYKSINNLFRFPMLLFPKSSVSIQQFHRMDSYLHSVNCQECRYDKNHNSDVTMIGSVPVCLKWKEHKQNSSLLFCTVSEFDHLGFERVQKGNSADGDKRRIRIDKISLDNNYGQSRSYNTRAFHHGNSDKVDKRRRWIDLENNEGQFRSNNRRSIQMMNDTGEWCESSLPNQYEEKRQSGDVRSENSLVVKNLHPSRPFDICESWGKENSQALWQVEVCDDEEISEYVAEATTEVLRPGMVLLKHYITPDEQVNIVNTCKKLGLGPGGFYRPRFKSGAQLRLQMMCLGLNWDHQTGKYEDKRAIDGAKPPDIPPEFAELVKKALKDAHTLIETETDTSNVEGILPSMSPDICIVNFYTTSGKLGLHQDRDESEESLTRRLPVVSFSLGDSADFLYGDQRGVDKAENVVLDSGDVLIFGGASRHIYHGVSSIIPNSAPNFLRSRTGLLPGRLNLTFRQY